MWHKNGRTQLKIELPWEYHMAYKALCEMRGISMAYALFAIIKQEVDNYEQGPGDEIQRKVDANSKKNT